MTQTIEESLREFLRKPRSVSQLAMDAKPPPPMPEAYEDYTYWDCPGRMTKPEWLAFVKMLGEGNWRALAITVSHEGLYRGQLFISPEGVRRMTAFIGRS